MKASPRPRKTANLSESVHHQLNMYALAASAAGIGIFAFAQPAGAKIIYTPAHVSIDNTTEYKLDLNHDGIADFKLGVYSFSTILRAKRAPSSGSVLYSDHMVVRGIRKSNAPVVDGTGFARAFGPGITIGPKRNFGNLSVANMARCSTVFRISGSSHYAAGPWLNVQNRYLGLRFTIQGKIHYGWARLTTTGCPLSGTLTGYAYETVPGKAIVTGKTKGPEDVIERPDATLTAPTSQPAGLGLLAMGTPGLSIWRRKDRWAL